MRYVICKDEWDEENPDEHCWHGNSDYISSAEAWVEEYQEETEDNDIKYIVWMKKENEPRPKKIIVAVETERHYYAEISEESKEMEKSEEENKEESRPPSIEEQRDEIDARYDQLSQIPDYSELSNLLRRDICIACCGLLKYLSADIIRERKATHVIASAVFCLDDALMEECFDSLLNKAWELREEIDVADNLCSIAFVILPRIKKEHGRLILATFPIDLTENYASHFCKIIRHFRN